MLGALSRLDQRDQGVAFGCDACSEFVQLLDLIVKRRQFVVELRHWGN